MIELNEAHAALGKPPREEAIGRIRPRLPRIRPVQLKRGLRFFGKIHQIGYRGLHAIRHFEFRHSRYNQPTISVLDVSLGETADYLEREAQDDPVADTYTPKSLVE